ncbi:MAG TPA: sulfatase-like hydrolase/transferase, partial [Candidatus Krumholzibacteria bacterium]|nr:sulfatase-like hydrolase/transferase [Candidatus Krumholzibacteria bacterium]
MRSSRPLIVALLLLSTLGLGCHSRKPSSPGQVGPFPKAPVVLISIDTLRSDHLPAYGYSKVKTPAIDDLVKDGVLFERAYSHIPLTLPSHVTILTGLLPTETGIRDNVGYHFDSAKFPYLPRLLGADGYTTGGAVSAFVLRGETGLANGFDFYQSAIEVRVSSSLGRSQRPGTETLSVAEPWLEKAAGGTKPVFLFFHIYEPHRPYNPPEPFLSRYGKTYDGEIASADAIIGNLVGELKKLGLYDRAIVVLLSDHGEGLDEHGEQEHGILLYREDLQVPLIIKLPNNQLAGTKVSAPAELSDITPTILQLVGLAPAKTENGRDLFAIDRPGAKARDIYSETYYPRIHMGWSQLTSLIRGHYQLIWGPDPELYDLKADPGETVNLIHKEERVASSLKRALRPYLTPLAAPSEESESTSRKLEALGYLSGSASVINTTGPLPDPKSRIGTLADFGRAMHLYSQQQFAQAVPLFRKLVKENPDMLDAWDNLGSSLQQLGRREEAL